MCKSKFVTWLTATATSVNCSAAESASLDEAIRQLAHWRAQFVSLRIKARRASDPATNASTRESGVQMAHTEIDWVWDDTGRFREEKVTWNDGQIVSRHLALADVARRYAFAFAAKDRKSPIPVSSTIYPRTSAATGTGFALPLYVLWDESVGTWLSDRLTSVSESEIMDDGRLQVVLPVAGYERYETVLDPSHGYLPTSGQVAPNRMCFQVDEFAEVQSGFWFPRRGTSAAREDHLQTWEISSVEINTEFPDSLFVPPLGPETYVHNTITGQQYWHGGKPPAHLAEAAAKAARPTAPPPNQSPLTATADQPWAWTPWLVAVGVVCLALGVWLRRRG
jgi:hypothetical protein